MFVLTDQYFIDSYYNIPKFDTSNIKIEQHIIETGSDYKRYALTDDGISPRGIPGKGDGLIVVDSDEHDFEGHITEDHDVRINMVDKRLKKLDSIIKEAIPPTLVGNEDSRNLVVCWGSTNNIVRESIERLERDDVSILHFKQVYPLYPDTYKYFEKAENRIIVENNATSQFGSLLKLFAGIDIQTKILKYDGLAFSVEELKEKLQNVIK